jgi:murein DD-endopeptidase / murein LD-carboxypeptidase
MRSLPLLVLLMSLLVTPSYTRPLPVPVHSGDRNRPGKPTPVKPASGLIVNERATADKVLFYGRRQLSLRYRRGGTGLKGYDCSGFTRACYSFAGIDLPRSSVAQSKVGKAVDKSRTKAGDLIFFGGHGPARISHVGVVVAMSGEGRRVRFIHSASTGGVRYDYLHAPYYTRRFRGIRRIVPVSVPAPVSTPVVPPVPNRVAVR